METNDESGRKTIVIRPHGMGFLASIGLGTELAAHGKEPSEAIGELVLLHGAELGIEIREVEKPVRPKKPAGQETARTTVRQHHPT